MTSYTITARQYVPRPLDAVFAFFCEPRNLARLTPPSLGFRLVDPRDPVMRAGLRLVYRIRPLLVPQTWISEITAYDPPHRFVDEQRQGPYASWHHEHTFEPVAAGTWVVDQVTYALPLGRLGALAHTLFVRRQLESIWSYRAAAIGDLFSDTPGPARSVDASGSTE